MSTPTDLVARARALPLASEARLAYLTEAIAISLVEQQATLTRIEARTAPIVSTYKAPDAATPSTAAEAIAAKPAPRRRRPSTPKPTETAK